MKTHEGVPMKQLRAQKRGQSKAGVYPSKHDIFWLFCKNSESTVQKQKDLAFLFPESESPYEMYVFYDETETDFAHVEIGCP